MQDGLKTTIHRIFRVLDARHVAGLCESYLG
jgi:hypothetical protein